jgi:glucosamine 6-phosphate synthetase-like amidotransferase/phosphosugar isomerase protein
MCGIAGFIGTSTNPDISHKIITKVFEELESRGRDAAGFWGCGEDQRVVYQKQPIRSSQMVHQQEWKKLKEFRPNLLLTHARGASQGTPQINKNNHPFTTTDYRVGMVHNGKVPNGQYECLTKK